MPPSGHGGISRRRFLAAAGLATAAGVAGPSWAEIGAPDLIAAAKDASGFRLLALRRSGDIVFDLPLPGRGHAAAAHPDRAEVVLVSRRPGTFALVLDCGSGTVVKRLTAPPGRHFYGHGTFSADGALLFTTENAYRTGAGRLGVWDVASDYGRIGEFGSGGIGPHDALLMPGGKTLAVANGGIRTHPDSGREKLNLPSMTPNLAYLRAEDGTVLQRVELPGDLRLNSIRHLAVNAGGLVAAALQWQGDPADGVPLLAFHRQGEPALRVAEADPAALAMMRGYAGSVAFDGSGQMAAITSPRGGRVMAWRASGGDAKIWSRPDVCGLAPAADGWIATDGLGGVIGLSRKLRASPLARQKVAFDNHLSPITESGR
ncbi:MAG: DUF1513 domain-containing protein [Pseudomonadota bacterium]